jgi:hypothetical protein
VTENHDAEGDNADDRGPQFYRTAIHLAAALPGLPAGKAPGYLPQQVCQQRGPGIIGYLGSSDCRVLVVSHKPIMIAAAAPLLLLTAPLSGHQVIINGHALRAVIAAPAITSPAGS